MSDSGGQTHKADWYPDPAGRYQLRYYDGTAWTEHVSTDGEQGVDPVPTGAPTTAKGITDMVINEADAMGWSGAQAAWEGGGHLLNEPILVVAQKAQIIELDNEYAIRDQRGQPLGYARQTGQSQAKKAFRALTSFDQYMTHKLEILDAQHNLILQITRPAKVFKSKVIVQNAAGQEIGQIVQQNMMGKIRFAFEAGGHTYGAVNAENWRAWDFHIVDHTGAEIGRITKTWEGLAKAAFTSADNYVVQLHRPLEDPLRSLVVAAAVGIDLAIKQDDSGFN